LGWQSPTLKGLLENESLIEEGLYDIASNFVSNEPSYTVSKDLLNIWVKKFLRTKLKLNQQAYAIHPGVVDTDMAAQYNVDVKVSTETIISALKGADTPVYLINLSVQKDDELHTKFFMARKVASYVDYEGKKFK